MLHNYVRSSVLSLFRVSKTKSSSDLTIKNVHPKEGAAVRVLRHQNSSPGPLSFLGEKTNVMPEEQKLRHTSSVRLGHFERQKFRHRRSRSDLDWRTRLGEAK